MISSVPRFLISFMTRSQNLAFILLDPHAEHFLAAGAHAQRNVDRLGADHALVADLDPDRIEEDERIGGDESLKIRTNDILP